MKDNKNPRVDDFLRRETAWKAEMTKLRALPLACELAEELKWGKPCYTLEGKNIVLIHGFKEYCALLFFKGVLLTDPHKILVQQTENVQAARQVRFRNTREIDEKEDILKAYIRDAIVVERSGSEVAFKKTSDYRTPEELQRELDRNRAAKTAFAALTPGRQRGYMFYISGAKQAKTREARVAKCIPMILRGKGLDD
jgi:uncharacterized protein YdeI (YjbR/CyaY-like superfamily)